MRGLLLRAGMQFYRERYWRPMERAAGRPGDAQRATLQRLLRSNRETRFGVAHGFADIATPRQFHERVPVQQYETLRPYVEDQRRTGAKALTAEDPLFYAQTSGSTGTPKYIPVTPTLLATHRAQQALFSYLQFRACPQAFAGKAFGIMGAAVEGRLDSGHTVGSVSGHLYQSLPALLRSRFVVPPAVSSIVDYDVKYLVVVLLALLQPDITYIGSPNPSTFLRLLDVLNGNRDRLIRAVETGQLAALDQLDPAVRAAIAGGTRPMPAVAERLRKESDLTFANVWPGIRLVTTWTGGSCGIALETLRQKLPSGTAVMELGYQATECRGSIAIEAGTSSGLPPLNDCFFEFAEQAVWDAGIPRVLTLEELEVGARYYIIVTTASGLYRYFMNDLVEVTGMFRQTPLVRFVQKGKGVTNLTGEKLYEGQVIEAVQHALDAAGVKAPFFVLIAEEQRLAYSLVIECDEESKPDVNTLAAAVDRRLGELNIEYHAKRGSGRLLPLNVRRLRRGAADAYKAACVRAGQREGQFKLAVLQYRKDLVMSFDEYHE
jgi:hypothetical protein